MKTIIVSPFAQHPLLDKVAEQLNAEPGQMTLRQFPDGESYVKFESRLEGKDLIILNSLDRPNEKILPLLFIAETAKALGARRVGLVAPYLAYMRQDTRFQPGEGITSDYFSALLSNYFDCLVTVDPHLHRHHQLSEIYTIPSQVLHASLSISSWIAKHVEKPLLIGPDSESEQWVSKVAQEANAPYLVLEKNRYGDHDVDVSKPDVEQWKNHTPVLVDDIVSTAQTMIQTVVQLNQAGMKPSICIGVHAVFAGNAFQNLLQSGAGKVVTCNTIPHPSNQIDVSNLLSDGIKQVLKT